MAAEKLNPDAFAAWGDERDQRDGVQKVNTAMIYDYVIKENELPVVSARPFAAWLDYSWNQYDDGDEQPLHTNRDIIHGALNDWCGGRTR